MSLRHFILTVEDTALLAEHWLLETMPSWPTVVKLRDELEATRHALANKIQVERIASGEMPSLGELTSLLRERISADIDQDDGDVAVLVRGIVVSLVDHFLPGEQLVTKLEATAAANDIEVSTTAPAPTPDAPTATEGTGSTQGETEAPAPVTEPAPVAPVPDAEPTADPAVAAAAAASAATTEQPGA